MRFLILALGLTLTGCASNRPQTTATPAVEVVASGTYDEVWRDLLDATTRLGFVPQQTDKESGVLVAEHSSAAGETREQWLDCGRRDGGMGPNFAKVWDLTPRLSAFVSQGDGGTHTVRLDLSGTASTQMMGTRAEQPCVSLRMVEREIADSITD